MSESLCKLIQKYEDKKYYGLCLLSLFLLTWFVIAFTGFIELASLFSNKHLGLIEAFLFTQIDLLSFQRSGIEVLSNNRWRSVTNDTFLNSYRYWYNLFYIALWFAAFRVLISKRLNVLILDIDFKKMLLSIKSLARTVMVGVGKAISSIVSYVKLEIKNINEVKDIEYNPQKKKVDRFDDFIVKGQWEQKQQDGKKFVHKVGVEEENNEPQHKHCPYCCEEVLYRAVKCKHCGSELAPPITQKKNIPTTMIASDSASPKAKNSYLTPKNIGIGVIAMLFISALNFKNQEPTITLSLSALCRAQVSAGFGTPFDSIRAEYMGNEKYKMTYTRKSDLSKWATICWEVGNNQLMWQSYDTQTGRKGRIRNSEYDEKVFFSVKGDKVVIEQVYSDGSRELDSFPISEFN